MSASSHRSNARDVHMIADDQERADRSIEGYGLTSWNDVLERRLCVIAPDPKNGSGETVITFEDLDMQGRPMGPLPSGYMGFTWSDNAWFMIRAYSWSVRLGLLNAHGRDISIESKHPFDLKGLSLCTLWADKVQVSVEGWEKEVRMYATTQTVSRASIHPLCPRLPRRRSRGA